jgi:hypothetical protein
MSLHSVAAIYTEGASKSRRKSDVSYLGARFNSAAKSAEQRHPARDGLEETIQCKDFGLSDDALLDNSCHSVFGQPNTPRAASTNKEVCPGNYKRLICVCVTQVTQLTQLPNAVKPAFGVTWPNDSTNHFTLVSCVSLRSQPVRRPCTGRLTRCFLLPPLTRYTSILIQACTHDNAPIDSTLVYPETSIAV